MVLVTKTAMKCNCHDKLSNIIHTACPSLPTSLQNKNIVSSDTGRYPGLA